MSESALAEILDHFAGLEGADKAEVLDLVNQETQEMKWIPNPGPQTDAFFCEADVLLYGGAGGGGKSDLGLGLAVTSHLRSLIMRRKYTDLAFLTDRTIEIWGTKKGFSGSIPPRFKLNEDKLIEYGAAQAVGDELSWMGRPHDLLYVDEAAHFAEKQIRNLMGWVRSPVPGQRVRVVLGSNPPLSDEGLWMLILFAPWLNPEYSNPAKPGELRWCIVNDDDTDVWVDGPGQYDMEGNFVTADVELDIEGAYTAMSRTFIPAKLADNPFQNTAKYRAQQDGLPKHMRDAIRDGNFLKHRKDHKLQVIPTEWIQAAMDRWTEHPPEGVPMCAVGVDLTGVGDDNSGKQDKFVIAPRYDGWYAKLIVERGEDVPFGKDKAGMIQTHRRDGATIILDMSGGYGDSTYEHLKNNDIRPRKYKGSAKSNKKSLHSNLEYYNKRTEAYCKFGEALDPSQPGGSHIKLPPNQLLLADLCAVRYDKHHEDSKVLKLETKEQMSKRLGRSSDYSDPVVMAWTTGPTSASHYKEWKKGRSARPQVITSGRLGRHRKKLPNVIRKRP
jgi:hypothetical protein